MDGDKTAPVTADALWERVLSAREDIAFLAHADLDVLAEEDAQALAVVVEEAARMLPLVQQSVVRQIRDRGMHTDREYKSPVPYLRDLLRITETDAAARVKAVERFHPRTGVSGEVLAPLYPEVASAVAGGVISMPHASVIAGVLDKLPAAVAESDRVAAEEALVQVAGELDPGAVKRAGKHLCAVLDPDGVLASEQEQRERQEFRLVPDLHGMYRLRGRLDASTANAVNLAVEALATPCPSADGTRDPRTATRRRADALAQIATMALDHPAMPTSGGHRPQILATLTLAELEQRAGTAWLNNGAPVSVQELLRIACDADPTLAVFGHHGEVLHYGRSQRLAPPGLRRALVARDHGCVIPGCDTPPMYTQAHHLTWWSHGGTTDIDNLALVCDTHHTAIHDHHIELTMHDGRPHTVPPTWLDPTQKPRRNHVHDRPRDLTRGTVSGWRVVGWREVRRGDADSIRARCRSGS